MSRTMRSASLNLNQVTLHVQLANAVVHSFNRTLQLAEEVLGLVAAV